MSESRTASGGGIGFPGALTIVFVVLKLTDVIQWSWLWVLSPLWISFIIGIVAFVIFFVFLTRRDMKKNRYRNLSGGM